MKETGKFSVIALLQKEIVDSFGRSINTARDCQLLSQDIFERCSEQISANTLRRFFGLVSTNFQPSESTLIILCRYCGFNSIEELTAHREQDNEMSFSGPDPEALLFYLVSFFKNVPAQNYNDETFLQVVRNTIMFLKRYPALRNRFQRAIAKTKNGQEFYFEQFVNLDELNGFYGEGLRYYLLEKRIDSAQIFGYGLLIVRAWLTEDSSALANCYTRMIQFSLQEDTHPFVGGRYFAAHLFYAEGTGANTQSILKQAADWHSKLTPRDGSYRQFPGFEFVFSFALLLTGYVEEALYYINHGKKHYPTKLSYLDEGYYQCFHLIEACCLVLTGKRQAAEIIYSKISPSRFYFLRRKTDMILFLHLEKMLRKKVLDFEKRLEELIEETGFKRLSSWGATLHQDRV